MLWLTLMIRVQSLLSHAAAYYGDGTGKQALIVFAPRKYITTFRACLHGGGGPQVGEVTSLGEVTRLSI